MARPLEPLTFAAGQRGSKRGLTTFVWYIHQHIRLTLRVTYQHPHFVVGLFFITMYSIKNRNLDIS